MKRFLHVMFVNPFIGVATVAVERLVNAFVFCVTTSTVMTLLFAPLLLVCRSVLSVVIAAAICGILAIIAGSTATQWSKTKRLMYTKVRGRWLSKK